MGSFLPANSAGHCLSNSAGTALPNPTRRVGVLRRSLGIDQRPAAGLQRSRLHLLGLRARHEWRAARERPREMADVGTHSSPPHSPAAATGDAVPSRTLHVGGTSTPERRNSVGKKVNTHQEADGAPLLFYRAQCPPSQVRHDRNACTLTRLCVRLGRIQVVSGICVCAMRMCQADL